MTETTPRRWTWILLVAALALVWLGVWQRERIAGWLGGTAGPDEPAAAAADADAAARDGGGPPAAAAAAAAEAARREEAWTDTLGRAPAWPADVADPRDCAAVRADWDAARRAVADLAGAELVAADVDAALHELLRNPPRPSGEIRDHALLLANATHLFRTLGRSRIAALRRALAEADARLEPLALAAARRVAALDACRGAEGFAPPAGPPPAPGAAEEYAAALFQTLGGQAYLRRRAPRVEALASFWAIALLDRADRAGRNPHGVDLLPEIRRTRALVDAEPFLFRDRYLQELDRIEDRWSRRAEEGGR